MRESVRRGENLKQKFAKQSPIPVIEALRAQRRRRGLLRVAEDFNLSPVYIESIAYYRRRMTDYVAGRLGFERVTIWQPVDVGARQPVPHSGIARAQEEVKKWTR